MGLKVRAGFAHGQNTQIEVDDFDLEGPREGEVLVVTNSMRSRDS